MIYEGYLVFKTWHDKHRGDIFGSDLSSFCETSTHTQTQKIFLISSGVVHRIFHIPKSHICNLQIQFQNQFGCNLYHRVVRLLHPPTKKVVYDRSSVFICNRASLKWTLLGPLLVALGSLRESLVSVEWSHVGPSGAKWGQRYVGDIFGISLGIFGIF